MFKNEKIYNIGNIVFYTKEKNNDNHKTVYMRYKKDKFIILEECRVTKDIDNKTIINIIIPEMIESVFNRLIQYNKINKEYV